MNAQMREYLCQVRRVTAHARGITGGYLPEGRIDSVTGWAVCRETSRAAAVITVPMEDIE